MGNKSVDEIYHSIGQYIINNVLVDNWDNATLLIEVSGKSVGLEGYLLYNSGKEGRFDAPSDFFLALDILNLHTITTKGGNNRWNKLKFVLYPTGKFAMDFIWDQEYKDEIDRLNKKS